MTAAAGHEFLPSQMGVRMIILLTKFLQVDGTLCSFRQKKSFIDSIDMSGKST